jgi:glutathione S-transferase
MELVGMMDSPYVRRVAISMEYLHLPFSHRSLSIFQTFEEFRDLHPLVKVPTLVCEDGEMLVDSGLIIDYLETISEGRTLLPTDAADRRRSLQVTGIALVAMEKTAQLIYELKKRPVATRHDLWIERLDAQLLSVQSFRKQTFRPRLPGASCNTFFPTGSIA